MNAILKFIPIQTVIMFVIGQLIAAFKPDAWKATVKHIKDAAGYTPPGFWDESKVNATNLTYDQWLADKKKELNSLRRSAVLKALADEFGETLSEGARLLLNQLAFYYLKKLSPESVA